MKNIRNYKMTKALKMLLLTTFIVSWATLRSRRYLNKVSLFLTFVILLRLFGNVYGLQFRI